MARTLPSAFPFHLNLSGRVSTTTKKEGKKKKSFPGAEHKGEWKNSQDGSNDGRETRWEQTKTVKCARPAQLYASDPRTAPEMDYPTIQS